MPLRARTRSATTGAPARRRKDRRGDRWSGPPPTTSPGTQAGCRVGDGEAGRAAPRGDGEHPRPAGRPGPYPRTEPLMSPRAIRRLIGARRQRARLHQGRRRRPVRFRGASPTPRTEAGAPARPAGRQRRSGALRAAGARSAATARPPAKRVGGARGLGVPHCRRRGTSAPPAADRPAGQPGHRGSPQTRQPGCSWGRDASRTCLPGGRGSSAGGSDAGSGRSPRSRSALCVGRVPPPRSHPNADRSAGNVPLASGRAPRVRETPACGAPRAPSANPRRSNSRRAGRAESWQPPPFMGASSLGESRPSLEGCRCSSSGALSLVTCTGWQPPQRSTLGSMLLRRAMRQWCRYS